MQSRRTAATPPSTRTTRSRCSNRIPFADMEAMIDPPTEDITGRLLELMGGYRLRLERSARAARARVPRVRRRSRTVRGGDAGASTSSTARGRCSRACARSARTSAPSGPQGRRWLESVQNADGGFGEDCGSYDEMSRRPGEGRARRRRPRGRSSACLPATRQAPARSSAASIISSRRRTTPASGTSDVDRHRIPAPLLPPLLVVPAYFPLMALGQYAARLRGENGA